MLGSPQTRHQQLIKARDTVLRQIELLRNPTRRRDYTPLSDQLIAELTVTLGELNDNLADLEPEDDQIPQIQTPHDRRPATVETPRHRLKPSALVLILLALLMLGLLVLRQPLLTAR
jgi:hypothetical protein